jgi:hypothetical protein
MIHPFKIGDKRMSLLLQEILNQAKQLPVGDRQELIRQLSEDIHDHTTIPPQPRRSWRELRGIAPNLLNGQDAQEWVNELRSEWDEGEQSLGKST